MKIVIATPIYPPAVGGPATHAAKYLEGFISRGIDARVVAYGARRSLDGRVRTAPLWLPYGIRHTVFFARLFSASRGADAVYALDAASAGGPARAVAILRGIPYFVRVGGDLLWERLAERGETALSMSAFYVEGRYETRALYRRVRRVLSGARRVVVVSDMLRDLYAGRYGIPAEKIHVIPNPLPIGRRSAESAKAAAPNIRSDKKIILYASRFVAYKNLFRLLSAFEMLHAKDSSLRLVLAGDGPEREKLSEEISRRGLGAFVVLAGTLSREKLMGMMEDAGACVAPALTEFYPNYVMECMAAGTPAAVSRENGLPFELPREFLFDPLDAADMARGIAAALATKPNFTTPIEVGPSWDSLINTTIELFKTS